MDRPETPRREWEDRLPYTALLALSDEDLMVELVAGNTDAFAVIFKRYHRLVHLVALRVLRDAGEAEDLTQSVFLEIYRKVGQFDPGRGTLKVWLLQHAQSRSINRRNYLLVRQFHKQLELTAAEEESGLWSPKRPPSQETKQVTSEALSTLPVAQRETIELYFFEGLSFKDIAERRSETFSNVRHHFYRGLTKLRAVLQASFTTGVPKKKEVPPELASGEA